MSLGRRHMASGDLACQQQCVERIRARWPAFRKARQAHLRSHSVGQAPTEKVAENILCDLFTKVLDWTTEQARLQENLIDLTLTRLGVKYLIVEAKRPGSLDGPGSIGRAVKQARGYAEDHKVDKIAVSDGCILEAYDLAGIRPELRVRTHLSDAEPPESLWWLSARGIYRTPNVTGPAPLSLLDDDRLVHPKYRLPASCFAYVGDPQRTSTWKLPYLEADGTVDSRRLPKAIQSVLRDYRGKYVLLPEEAVPDVLARLAGAAARQGRMPDQDPTPAPIYLALRDSLRQCARS